MKKKKIIIVIIILAIFLIGLGVAYLFTSEQQEPTVPTEPYDRTDFDDSIEMTVSQSHYELILNLELVKEDDTITGTYQFDINHGQQLQNIVATVVEKGEMTTWNSHVDEFDNKYYYEDATQGIVVPDQADVEYIFELMRNASNVTDNSFSLTASSVAETLDSTTMRYLSGVSGDNTVVVDNDVVFTYEKEVDIFKKLSSTFTINGGQQVTVSYELTTLTDTVA